MVSTTSLNDIDFEERVKIIEGLETKMYGLLNKEPKFKEKGPIFDEVKRLEKQMRDIENTIIEADKYHLIKVKKEKGVRTISARKRILARRQLRKGKVRELKIKYHNYCRDNKVEMEEAALQERKAQKDAEKEAREAERKQEKEAEKEKIIEYKKQFKEEWKYFKEIDSFKEKLNSLLYIEPQNERLEYVKWCIGVLREEMKVITKDRKEVDVRLKNAYSELEAAKIKFNDNEISEDEYLLKKEAHKAIKDEEKCLKKLKAEHKNALRYFKLEIKNGDFKQQLNIMIAQNAAQDAGEVLA